MDSRAARQPHSVADAHTITPKHSRIHAFHSSPGTRTLLRLPSSSFAGTPQPPRSRRATNPARTPDSHASSPAAPAAPAAPASSSPQHAAHNSTDVRSPGTRRPPASFSSNGVDTSQGPPVRLQRLGLVSPAASGSSAREYDTATFTRQQSTQAATMAQESSSDYDAPTRSRFSFTPAASSRHGDADAPGADGGEDLFLHIAEDNATRDAATNITTRSDRSRIARASNRQSLPSVVSSNSPATSGASRANGTRIPGAIDTQTGNQYRRSSFLPSTRNTRESTPLTPANPSETQRSRLHELSPKRSFAVRPKDAELSPQEFLDSVARRPSQPEALYTPPNRTGTFKPSNLHYYSSSRDNPETAQVDSTESHGSTGNATSVWDDLDNIKTRLQRLEMGGKIPATSGAVVAQASADRPRTANTSITTVSSSPHQHRKPSSDSAAPAAMPIKVHPLLSEALAKAKQHTAPTVYRVLEATASEALALAELTGSGGPQGTFHSTSSILGGASMPDRNVRRKADNICRSLTELCIALGDTKSSIASPAVNRTSAAAPSRRPSLQINGESPSIRQSIEPESDVLPRSSPSRAMSRIEARRTSIQARREASQEPPTPSQLQAPSRFERAGTSLYRARRNAEPEDDEPTLRAPSRAVTDFRDIRSAPKSRFSREYTSREPMPDLQPSPALQTTFGRRPTVTGTGNENNLQYRERDSSRQYGLDHPASSAYEKHHPRDPVSRTQFSNRNSIGGSFPLGRSASLNRRIRGPSAGE